MAVKLGCFVTDKTLLLPSGIRTTKAASDIFNSASHPHISCHLQMCWPPSPVIGRPSAARTAPNGRLIYLFARGQAPPVKRNIGKQFCCYFFATGVLPLGWPLESPGVSLLKLPANPAVPSSPRLLGACHNFRQLPLPLRSASPTQGKLDGTKPSLLPWPTRVDTAAQYGGLVDIGPSHLSYSQVAGCSGIRMGS